MALVPDASESNPVARAQVLVAFDDCPSAMELVADASEPYPAVNAQVLWAFDDIPKAIAP